MAWIKKYAVASGTRYRVYWKDLSGRQQGKVFSRLAEARSYKRELEQRLETGSYTSPARGRITLRELWSDFEATPHRPLAASTASLYRLQWRLHIDPALGDRRINSIEPGDVRRFIAQMEADGVGLSMIDSTFRLLRSMLSLAVRDRRISLNPASGIQPPRAVPKEMRFLNASEVNAIADCIAPRYRALVLTLAYTGVRIGEAAALRVRRVDLLHRRIEVLEAAAEVDGMRFVGETKTRQKRSVAIPAFLSDILAEHIALYAATGPDALVFTSEAASPVSQHAFRRTFHVACRKASVAPVPRVHDLRHTAAALAISAGGHAKLVQDMLGHSSIATTMNVYGHLFDSLHADVAQKLDALYADASSAGDEAMIVTQIAKQGE